MNIFYRLINKVSFVFGMSTEAIVQGYYEGLRAMQHRVFNDRKDAIIKAMKDKK